MLWDKVIKHYLISIYGVLTVRHAQYTYLLFLILLLQESRAGLS